MHDTTSVKNVLRSLSVAVLAGAMLVACASTPDDDIYYVKRPQYCLGGDIPSCIEKVGKPTRCFCADEDALRELIDPNYKF